jgi:hypothetical protein
MMTTGVKEQVMSTDTPTLQGDAEPIGGLRVCTTVGTEISPA